MYNQTKTCKIKEKVTKDDKIHKIHAPKFQGHVFAEVAEAAAGMLIGHTKLKVTKIDKIHKVHAPKFQGRVFSGVAEAPQARGLGTPSS